MWAERVPPIIHRDSEPRLARALSFSLQNPDLPSALFSSELPLRDDLLPLCQLWWKMSRIPHSQESAVQPSPRPAKATEAKYCLVLTESLNRYPQ